MGERLVKVLMLIWLWKGLRGPWGTLPQSLEEIEPHYVPDATLGTRDLKDEGSPPRHLGEGLPLQFHSLRNAIARRLGVALVLDVDGHFFHSGP